MNDWKVSALVGGGGEGFLKKKSGLIITFK